MKAQRLLRQPRIAGAWTAAQGHAPGEADVDRVYEVFVPMNAAVVTDFATLIEGAAQVVERARGRGLKIGSTTGYTRDIIERLTPAAAAISCMLARGLSFSVLSAASMMVSRLRVASDRVRRQVVDSMYIPLDYLKHLCLSYLTKTNMTV